ncbi:hypothetical protein AUP68_00643 [Ilyonectria robusta]
MAQQYAKAQSDNYSNYIKNVAVVGATGNIGKNITESLIGTEKHVVTAITRVGSTSQPPSGVLVAHVDYNDESSLVAALKGQEFLIICLSLSAPPDTHGKLVKAAAKAGVPYVMPNAYGIDFYGKEGLRKDIPIGSKILDNTAQVEELGMTWVALTNGFWYEYSLGLGPELFGVDVKNRKVTLYDGGCTHINTSTMKQCGRAVASLLSLKKLPIDENDQSVTISRFANKPLYISSFSVSQRDIFDSVKRVTGTSEEDWQVAYQPAKERYQEGLAELEQGNQLGFYKAMYARTFYRNGDGTFETVNDDLGLPNEDLDEATSLAVHRGDKDS